MKLITKQEQKLLDEIKEENGIYFLKMTLWNISLEPKSNKRRYEAMYSLKEKGLINFEEKYLGKFSSESGTLAKWNYTIITKARLEEKRDQAIRISQKYMMHNPKKGEHWGKLYDKWQKLLNELNSKTLNAEAL